MRTLAILGGTFDPIHFGHLRTALELKQQLGLDEVRLLPCHVPAHRQAPHCSAAQRLTMLELALGNEPQLSVDKREIERAGESYMVDTLASLREELGDQVSLSLVVGMDSFLTLSQWHQWQRLALLAHIIVIARPGIKGPTEGVMKGFLKERKVSSVDALKASACGCVLVQQLTPLAISATHIRDLIGKGQSPRYLLPESVWDYIQQQKLYGYL